MKIDLREFARSQPAPRSPSQPASSQPADLQADLCIIGAGIAGISIARSLLGSGLKVALLESGGVDHEPAVQELAAGDSIGFDYYPLVDSRLRMFGGTTAIWGGRVAMLDDIDFHPRDWVPDSGWPFPIATLQPWYDRARQALDLSAATLDESLFERLGIQAPEFDPEWLRVAFWQFDRMPHRYGLHRCDDLIADPDTTIVLHATATHIQAEPDGRRIRHVEVADLSGVRAIVQARRFVLAAGGIDNPRLLLASRDVMPTGLGNGHDLVGRYFMEHPHARGGRVRFKRPWSSLDTLMVRKALGGERFVPCFRPGEALQRRAGILNTSFALGVRQHPDQRMQLAVRLYQAAKHSLAPTRANRSLWQSLKRSLHFLQRHTDPLRPWLLDRLDRRGIYAVVRAEQAPNPASRVQLGSECDALGVPRADLDWQLSDLDKRSVRVLMEAFDRELRRLDLGHVELPEWLLDEGRPWRIDPLVSGHPIGGYHHIGTTRMASDAGKGVVDAEGRVFGLANLYVAGSSVFSTSGWANPTLTLLALSLRLAEHLGQALKDECRPIEIDRQQVA